MKSLKQRLEELETRRFRRTLLYHIRKEEVLAELQKEINWIDEQIKKEEKIIKYLERQPRANHQAIQYEIMRLEAFKQVRRRLE